MRILTRYTLDRGRIRKRLTVMGLLVLMIGGVLATAIVS